MPTSSSCITGAKVLDLAELRGLARLGGVEFVDEVVAMFLQTTPARIAAAEAAAAQGDAAGVRSVVHAVGSSASTLGVRRVERLAKSIESHIIANEWPRVLAMLPELTPALVDAAEALATSRAAGMFEALPPIAVIAGDPLERTLVHAALAERYDLSDHASGDSALAALRHTTYGAVVLSAVSAHGMAAAAVLRVIRETVSLRHLPVVALVNPGEEESYRAMGADASVSSSPVDAAHLRALVDRLMADGRGAPCSCDADGA